MSYMIDKIAPCKCGRLPGVFDHKDEFPGLPYWVECTDCTDAHVTEVFGASGEELFLAINSWNKMQRGES